MKKFITLLIFVMSTLVGFSQYYEETSIDAVVNGKVHICADNEELLGVIIHGERDCPNQTWKWFYDSPAYFTINADSIVLPNNHEEECIKIHYMGCAITFKEIHVVFVHNLEYEPLTTNPIIWKRPQEPIMLTNPWDSDPCGTSWGLYSWSTGENTYSINVNNPGTYSVILNHPCNQATYSVEVRDNVELYRATVDLQTNKNKVTWQTAPEQADYITDVKVYRDDVFVGTAPYTDGYFLDAIGSDAAARNYRIVGVSKEGDDCPIPSYEKGTIHTTYYEDVDGNLNMTWNTPYVEEGAQGTLSGFQICKYESESNKVTVVDQVNASITDYTCNSSAFDGGQATIAAVFNSKPSPLGGDGQRPEGLDNRSFSNLNKMIAVSENEVSRLKVYPNPSNGTFTVEGDGRLSVLNLLGQEILTQEVEGKTTLELPQGIYFVKLGSATRKVVVE